jgi:hypothetical protein
MTMSGPDRELTPDEQAETAALSLGRSILGRDLTADEAESLALIFRSAGQALRHGYIRRLAEHVAAERTDEAIEEFFEGQIQTD